MQTIKGTDFLKAKIDDGVRWKCGKDLNRDLIVHDSLEVNWILNNPLQKTADSKTKPLPQIYSSSICARRLPHLRKQMARLLSIQTEMIDPT
jgi:hypothetical protein